MVLSGSCPAAARARTSASKLRMMLWNLAWAALPSRASCALPQCSLGEKRKVVQRATYPGQCSWNALGSVGNP